MLLFAPAQIIHMIDGRELPIEGVLHAAPDYDPILDLGNDDAATDGSESNILSEAGREETIKPYFPPTADLSTISNENVFFLQLESGNALLAGGYFDEDRAKIDYIPSIREISKNGIFFPLFWGNAIQTNRAQEVMLCGVIGNMAKGFSLRLSDLTADCLPALLKKSGYKTIVFRSDHLGFMNTGKFFKKVGFEEVHHSDIMQPGDVKHKWGYDDCTFYQRAFEYLEKKYPSPTKMFVYFEVSSHHVGFEPKQKYAFTHPFSKPKNYAEKYLNSYAEQDHCVKKFYNEYSKYSPENSHLFLLPDHSWPIKKSSTNGQGAFTENFLIHLSYFPPLSRSSQFRVGEEVLKRYGQADLLSTVFDLLNGRRYNNSFGFAFRKNEEQPEEYEDCHVLTQPYGGAQFSAIWGQDDYYTYKFSDRSLWLSRISEDITQSKKPTLIKKGVSYKKFREKFYCPRYLR